MRTPFTSWAAAVCTVLCLAGTASIARAADEPVKDACKGDAETLCKGVQPGGGRIAACLKEHKDQVSTECKQAVMAHRGDHHRRMHPGGKASDAQ